MPAVAKRLRTAWPVLVVGLAASLLHLYDAVARSLMRSKG